MKKSFVTAMIAALAATLIVAPVYAVLPDTYTSTDPNELNAINIYDLTEEELRTAYDALRLTYINLYSQAQSQPQAPAQPAPVNVVSDVWDQTFYLDEFQNMTDRAYIYNKRHFTGTFSNTATTDSGLEAVAYIERDYVSISLLEYKRSLVTGYYTDGETYEVNVLTPTGETIGMTGMLYKGATGILLQDFSPRFIDLLKTGQEIKVSMRAGTSSYYFVIPASSGFADMYQATFG